MAIDKTVRYPGRWDTATEYPLGKPKNRTSSTSKDGTYFEKDWMADHEALISSLFSSMGKSINTTTNTYGDVDEVGNSQIFRALKELIAGGATLHTDSGTANAYVLTSTFGEAPELFDGIKVTFIATNDSTGASTINVNSNGDESLVLNSDGDAVYNEIESGKLYEAYYDLSNTRWILSSGVRSKITELAKDLATGWGNGSVISVDDITQFDFLIAHGNTSDSVTGGAGDSFAIIPLLSSPVTIGKLVICTNGRTDGTSGYVSIGITFSSSTQFTVNVVTAGTGFSGLFNALYGVKL